MKRRSAREQAAELLDLVIVSDPERLLSDFPRRFSGGTRQLVMIAIALAREPKLLIADEPATGLDPTIQAQILELIRRLRESLVMTRDWISQDLGVIEGIADRTLVMYAGQIVEQAPVEEPLAGPRSPYTRVLLDAAPAASAAARQTVVRMIPPAASGRGSKSLGSSHQPRAQSSAANPSPRSTSPFRRKPSIFLRNCQRNGAGLPVHQP